MRQMQPVLWTKGVILSPQHLQLQDRFLEDMLSFRLSAVSAWRWGFAALAVDREALAEGMVSLDSARGVFQDGLTFDVPGADAAPAARAVDDLLDPGAEAGLVHLAISEWKRGGTNVALSPGTGARFEAEMVHRRDDTTGDGEKPVLVGRKNLRLVGEAEEIAGLLTLPVARLLRSASGEVSLDPAFVPPVVNHGASDHLVSLNRRLLEIMTARSATLAGGRRQRNLSLADFGVADVAGFWLLYTVNSYLPLIRHFLESGHGHPLELFRTWSALAGALTTFSDRITPADLPEYDHADLRRSFEALDDLIRDLLATVVPSTHVSLPLRPTRTHIHATALDEERYLDATETYLALRSELGPDELAQRVPQLVKVSSGDRVEVLIRQALPGVALRHVADPPGSLPVKLDYSYFRLERTGPEWEAVRRSRNIAVYLPADFPAAEGEIVLLLPRSDEGR
ncbi:type VI secretion system baseplate subunit TssK [Gemmatimonadota bacterium DH-20]|uniref:Type VI secretion system baseplate subunit TssK n=1 Tax=Gaopeijia maritima TaxID=3119007 RepID=A0ABU9EB58_9BACT